MLLKYIERIEKSMLQELIASEAVLTQSMQCIRPQSIATKWRKINQSATSTVRVGVSLSLLAVSPRAHGLAGAYAAQVRSTLTMD